jgi:hypothetical protein
VIVPNDTYEAKDLVLKKSDYVKFKYEPNGDWLLYKAKSLRGKIRIPKKTLRPCVLFNNLRDKIKIDY